MRGWSDLPTEVRQKCVKNMSLMSRIYLRNCSRKDRRTVDAVSLKVPRVKISVESQQCTLEIYGGIDDFIKLQVCQDNKNGKITIYRSQGGEQVKVKILTHQSPESSNLENFSFTLLKSILSRKNVKLNILETQGESPEKIIKLCSENQLKFLKIVRNTGQIATSDMSIYDVLEKFKNEAGDRTFLENPAESYKYHVQLDGDVGPIDKPTVITEIQFENFKDTTLFFNHKFGEHGNMLQEILGVLHALCHFYDRKPCSVCLPKISREKASEVFQKVPGEVEIIDESTSVKRYYPMHDLLFRFNIAPCGFWVEAMIGTQETARRPCGMGIACKQHTDPFHYWYYHSLPGRILKPKEKEDAPPKALLGNKWVILLSVLVAIIALLVGWFITRK